MTIVSYLSEIIIPFVIVFVIGYGIVEKKNVYDIHTNFRPHPTAHQNPRSMFLTSPVVSAL